MYGSVCTTFCLTTSEKGRWPAVFLSVDHPFRAPQLRGFFFAQASGDKHG
ncbi:hypothetical protein NLN82_14945 [Citrobacter portucalensis]|nr:hypothetical protein [Citrobacter portucalensis]MCX8968860.1 hypothetical protein [Citrobacter portucalensis]MCX9037330.1 hypothetical protein [Citrobacter portucalensis]